MDKNKISFEDQYNLFFNYISYKKQINQKSSFWESAVKDFINDKPLNKKIIFGKGLNRNYGFFYKKNEDLIFKFNLFILKIIQKLLYITKFIQYKLWIVVSVGLGIDYYPQYIQQLKKFGIYKEYKIFCKLNRFSFYSWHGAKLFYCSSKIKNFIPKDMPKIIEIGGGMGTLASILNHKHSIYQYVIVDINEMLLNSSLVIKSIFPEANIYFLYPNSEQKFMKDKPGFYFCTPESIDLLPKDYFNKGICFDALNEMTENQVNEYITLMQRVLKNNSYFSNLARRKFLVEEKFDNNPLLYKFFSENKIEIWETDEFMNNTANYVQNRIDGWIWRTEKIIKINSK